MFRRKLQTLNSWKCILNFFLQILCIISKLPGQCSTYISCLIFIFNKAYPAKKNDTFYIKSPIAFLPIALVIYTVTGFIAGFYRVDLISLFSSMKVDLSILFTIPMIYRKPIRVPIISYQ